MTHSAPGSRPSPRKPGSTSLGSGRAASSWTGRNWPLSFHRWPLREATETEAVRITVGDLSLPRAGDRPEHASHPLLRNLTGQPFLLSGPQGPNQLPVSFDVQPDPRTIPGLARFVAQLVSEDAGPTGVAASVKLSTTGRSGYKATFRRLRGASLEQGWHYIRVLPQDRGRRAPAGPARRRGRPANESERFFVVVQAADRRRPG